MSRFGLGAQKGIWSHLRRQLSVRHKRCREQLTNCLCDAEEREEDWRCGGKKKKRENGSSELWKNKRDAPCNGAEKKLSIESIQLLLWPSCFSICWCSDLSFLLAFVLSPIPSAPHSLVPLPHAALTSVTWTWFGWGHERRLKPFSLLDQSSSIEGPGKMRRQWLIAERIKHSFYNYFGQMKDSHTCSYILSLWPKSYTAWTPQNNVSLVQCVFDSTQMMWSVIALTA